MPTNPPAENWAVEFDERFLRDFDMEIVDWIDENPSHDEIKSFLRTTIEKALEEQRGRIEEEVKILRPLTCGCTGEKYSCEHWGRHETVDEVLQIIQNMK